MNLGPVTKLNKRNKATSKKIDDGVMSANYDVIVIFSDFRTIWSNPEARSLKPTFSLIATFYLTKTENRTKKSLIQSSHNCFE